MTDAEGAAAQKRVQKVVADRNLATSIVLQKRRVSDGKGHNINAFTDELTIGFGVTGVYLTPDELRALANAIDSPPPDSADGK
jgi:hypothetical protein